MRKQKLNNAKAADLTVFYDENDPQQYLVYTLKFGETVIGGNPDKSSLVLHFTSELDDAHAKITVEDEDYSLEDLGSHKGTFKIKSDNSLIRLKPFKAYDLAPQTAFYLGRFKCIFRAVKTGRNDGLFSLSPLDGHSQRGKDNSLKRQVSYDDIEEDELFRRSKKGLLQKLSKNQKESEHIEEEEEHKEPASRVNLNKVVGQIVSKKDVQSQKQFVKSKGQLPKVEKSKDEESVKLNQSFLKRIQEKLMNSQISKQKDLISEMGAKYSSQSQKKNQDLKSQVKEVEKEDDEEETWKPLKIKNSKKGSEILQEKKKNKEEKIEEKNQNKINKIIEEIMSTNLGQKIAKVREEKEQKAKQKEEKQSAKIKLDSKVDKKVAEVVNGDTKGKEKKNSKNQITPDKSTINEKIEKILSNFESEKKDEEKEEIKVKDRKGKAKEKQEKKDQKVTETKKEEEIQKPTQKEIKQQKGKQKKGQKIVEEEDNQEEMVLEKKSVSMLKGKKNTLKSEIDEDIPKKSAGKQKVEQIKVKEDSPKKISSKKKAEISEDSSKKEKTLLGKRKVAKSEIEIVEEIPKKKVKKVDEKEQKGTEKNANAQKKDKENVKSSSAAKRELAQLISDGNVIQEGARRGKLKVLFSNSCVDDLEREKLRLLGVKIVEDFESASEFNILVTDQIVRRIKILVAINQAIPIVSSDWAKEAIKQQAIIPFEPFIISKASKSLSKQYSFDLSQSIIRQFDHPQGVLSGVSFSLPYPLDNISTQELRKLLLSAGATFSSSSSIADTYTITEASKKEQNEELLKLGVKLVSHEGILQSCLLQINVLDDYLIEKAAVSSKKKATKK